MRIGTWNLDARWDERHRGLVVDMDCDVWLLTEVSDAVAVPGFEMHATVGRMSRGQRWASVLSASGERCSEPDPATACVRVPSGLTVWSSVLPWRTCGPTSPWPGARHNDRMDAALERLRVAALGGPLIWGGDWNHAFEGYVVGSRHARAVLRSTVDDMDLQVPTACLPHQREAVFTIDHIAVPKSWRVNDARRIEAASGSARLSDHDLYVVEVDEVT